MTTTPHLGLTHLEENASSPEVRVNEADDGLDYAMNGSVSINFSSDADLTLSTSGAVPQQWQYGTTVFTDTGPVLTTGRNVIVPVNKRIYRIVNNTAQTLTVKTSAGTGIAVVSSGKAFLQCDGTNVIDVTPAGGATDANAIHGNVASEISALTTVTVASGDYLLIEDASDSNNKKKILASDLLGGGTDAAAIHDNTSNEITAITAKATMDRDDELLIEDSEDSYNKKAVTHSTLMLLEENAQTGTTYTLALDDENKMVTMSNASSNTLTVPPNSSVAFPVGAQVVISQEGAGQTTIAAGAGVTINNPSTLLLRARYSKAALVKKATDEWDLIGDTE